MSYPAKPATGKTKKTYTPQFKFNLVKEAIKTGNLSIVSRKYNVGVNVISVWVKHLDEQGFRIFETSPDQQQRGLKNQIAKLEQMVGRKEVELNLLKNFSDFYASPNTG